MKLVFAFIATDSAQVAQHTSLWAIVVSIGVVLGVFAAIQQLSTWVRRRPYRKAEERILEVAETALNAEEAQRSFETYRTLGADLRRQVEYEVPREARRVFLRSRRELLGTYVEEYMRVEQELATLEQRSPAALDHRLRGVIEQSIRPPYLRRRRTEYAVLALLGLLVLIAASPWSISALLAAYVALMQAPTAWSDGSVVAAVVSGIVVFAVLGFVGTGWLRNRYAMPLRRRQVLVPGGIVLAACVAALAIGLLARQSSQFATYDDGFAFPGGALDVAYTHKAEAEATKASALLSSSTPVVGLLVGALVAAGWPVGVASRRGRRVAAP